MRRFPIVSVLELKQLSNLDREDHHEHVIGFDTLVLKKEISFDLNIPLSHKHSSFGI